MFVRSVSFVAALAAVVLLPLACGSFSADGQPVTGPAGEGGASEGGGGVESGPAPDGSFTEGGTTSAPVVLAMGYKALRAITATEADVYFIDQAGGGGVFAVPISGGDTRTLATGGAPSSIAVDEGFVYWTDPATRTVARADIGTGTKTVSPRDTGSGFPPTIVVGATGAIAVLVGSIAATGEIRQYPFDQRRRPRDRCDQQGRHVDPHAALHGG